MAKEYSIKLKTEVVKDYLEDKHSLRGLAVKFHVPKSTIEQWVKDDKLKKRAKLFLNKDDTILDHDRLLEMFKNLLVVTYVDSPKMKQQDRLAFMKLIKDVLADELLITKGKDKSITETIFEMVRNSEETKKPKMLN